MPSAKRFFHSVKNDMTVASVGSAYSASKYHAIDLLPDWTSTTSFDGYIEQLTITTSTIVSATETDFKICSDMAGDYIIIPTTSCHMERGTTTASIGNCIIKIGAPITLEESKYLYIFFKSNSGTFSIEKSSLIWSE